MMLANLFKKIKLLKRSFLLIKTLEPWFISITILQSMFNAAVPFVNIFISGVILNALAEKKSLKELLILVAIMVSVNLLLFLINKSLTRITNVKAFSCFKLIETSMSTKIQQMDYEDVENPKIHMIRQKVDDYNRWSGMGVGKLLYTLHPLINGLFIIIFSVVIVFSAFTVGSDVTGAWTFVNSPIFAVLILVLICGNVISSMIINTNATKAQLSLGKKLMPLNRIFFYYYELAQNYKVGKDVRLYNQANVILHEGFDGMLNEGMKHLGTTLKRDEGYKNIREIINTVVIFMIYCFVSLRALFGLYSIGGIVQYVGAIQQFMTGLTDMMVGIVTCMNSCEAIGLYFEFMDMPSKMYQGSLPVEKRDDNEYEIEFHDVSFKYPGTDIYVLQKLNLKLKIGQKMAVVGMNGSGKTTMIKLLCRLYDPTDGYISLNGIDIKKYDYKEYMSIFSVVFQDFKLFAFTLGQNIATSTEYDKNKVEECIHKAGFDERYAKMENGVDTILYKDFDEGGVEVSGGEAQKIALARALYKNAPFVVLDEPTAALDPVAEYDIYSRFNEMVDEKTAIYISHRLSSCRFCDNIAVFDKGRLVQHGSHDDLIADEHGKYYELWNAQAQYYTEETA